jgi:hypothetical protein
LNILFSFYFGFVSDTILKSKLYFLYMPISGTVLCMSYQLYCMAVSRLAGRKYSVGRRGSANG